MIDSYHHCNHFMLGSTKTSVSMLLTKAMLVLFLHRKCLYAVCKQLHVFCASSWMQMTKIQRKALLSCNVMSIRSSDEIGYTLLFFIEWQKSFICTSCLLYTHIIDHVIIKGFSIQNGGDLNVSDKIVLVPATPQNNLSLSDGTQRYCCGLHKSLQFSSVQCHVAIVRLDPAFLFPTFLILHSLILLCGIFPNWSSLESTIVYLLVFCQHKIN